MPELKTSKSMYYTTLYTVVPQGGRPSNRTILPISRLTGQFCFLVVRLTGQLEISEKVTGQFFSAEGRNKNYIFILQLVLNS